MSEKTVWDWLKKGLNKHGAKGTRLENCNRKGISDSVVKIDVRKHFIELKDWTSPKKHPLSVEQRNFSRDFDGWVLVKTKKGFYFINDVVPPQGLDPLLVCDVVYVEEEGELCKKDHSNLLVIL